MFKKFKEFKEKMRKQKRVKVFTYGTLKEGEHNNYLLYGAELVDIDKLYGYKLYDMPFGFPCVVPTGDEKDYVIGEVYEVTTEHLEKTLDKLEGYIEEGSKYNLYNRTLETTYLGHKAWIYHYARPIQNSFIHMESGVWTGWLNDEHYNN